MDITVSIHEVASWLLTVVVFTLYLIERRKNSTTPYYAALQGILRACREKSSHLALLAKSVREDQREAIPKSEILLYFDISQTEFTAMTQQIAGTIKAILPDEPFPINDDNFSNPKTGESF